MAEPEGALTASGLLYEGNFNDWQQRMSAAFIVKGKPSLAYPALRRTTAMPLIVPYHLGSAPDLQYLADQVSPALLARVSRKDRRGVGYFYAALKKLCMPFKLKGDVELPPEIRNMVYEQVIEEGMSYGTYGEPKPWVVQASHRFPALAQVDRELRREFLPLYFATCTFFLDALKEDQRA